MTNSSMGQSDLQQSGCEVACFRAESESFFKLGGV